MAYDVDLADRIRARLSAEPDVTEKQMFGGLAFLVGGHLAVSASGRGGLLLRVEPEEQEALLEDRRAGPFVMRGREMTGWLHVDLEDASEVELGRWVDRGVAVARSLPPR
jgi:hypothetical protein